MCSLWIKSDCVTDVEKKHFQSLFISEMQTRLGVRGVVNMLTLLMTGGVGLCFFSVTNKLQVL